MNDTPCAVQDCARSAFARGWCKSHWQRWSRTGDPGPAEIVLFRDLTGQRFGTLVAIKRVKTSRGVQWLLACDCGEQTLTSTNALTTGRVKNCANRTLHRRRAVVTYSGTHWRTRRLYGSARQFTCVVCGVDAEHWSYDHKDTDELRHTDGYPYSLNAEHYQPLCQPCHIARDLPYFVPTPTACEDCGKTFASRRSLSLHASHRRMGHRGCC